MKTLYLDCSMGAAGDMLAAALLELLPDADAFLAELGALDLPGVEIRREPSVKCGIAGTRFCVTVDGEEEQAGGEPDHAAHGEAGHAHPHAHPHAGIGDIEHLVRERLRLPEGVKRDVLAVYALLAEAESHVHGEPVGHIHFHEVGTMDAVADICAVCLLMDRLSPDEVVVSPVHVGSGQVRCAHGILPVPAPATAYLLRGVPVYGGAVRGELCTPTGAALLRHFATRFGDLPPLRLQAVGYGMGKRDFEAANCVRAMLGEAAGGEDEMLELSCNVDDMTAEQIGFAMERLFEGGAPEVYTVPIGMKKSRPGTLIRVICRERDRERLLRLMFQHTSTLGIREARTRRYVLDRHVQTLSTPYGDARLKCASGYGVSRQKVEYEDLARIARALGVSMEEAKRRIAPDGRAPRPTREGES